MFALVNWNMQKAHYYAESIQHTAQHSQFINIIET